MNKRCIIISLIDSLFQAFCNLKVILNLDKIPEKRSPLRGKKDCTFVQALGDPGTTIHLARFTSILSHPSLHAKTAELCFQRFLANEVQAI